MRSVPQKHPAIFLHGGWRCASTYLWSQFRHLSSTLCFYEPFGEALARCSPKRIRRDTADGWDSRHPPGLPYRTEYLPLLHPLLTGVPQYREKFALARYFPTAAGVAAEARYLSRLIGHARQRGKHPVLGFSRSLGRAVELKAALDGYHIIVQRDPLQQWLSCRSYRGRVPLAYFELCHFLILALAPARSPAGRFARMLGLPRLPRGLQRQLKALHAAIHPWSDELSYRAFTAVSLLSHALAEPAADLLLDVDRLGRSSGYREMVSARILAAVGLALDFEDCSVPTHDPALVPVDLNFAAVERSVREHLACCGADLAPAHGGQSLIKDLADNPICAIEVDQAVPCVKVVWKRYGTSAQLRFVHEHILHLLQTHRIKAVLGDDTDLPTIHAEDQRWIIENWLPRARSAGLKAAASKRPRTHLGKLAVDAVQSFAPPGVQLRSFEKVEDARDWLLSAVAS